MSVPSSATNAHQPICGVLNCQAPSCQAAIALLWPAQSPDDGADRPEHGTAGRRAGDGKDEGCHAKSLQL
jgi:hypothetical protein